MSGQLVGEVVDAMRPGGPLACLSPTDRLALIAVAHRPDQILLLDTKPHPTHTHPNLHQHIIIGLW